MLGRDIELRSLTLPASMRGPVDVKKIFRSSSWGIAQGGLAPLVGGAAARRRGGNPPAPTSPWGERERGIHDSFLAAAGSLRCSALASFITSASPTRLASIRTLLWSILLRCQLVSFIFETGAAISDIELSPLPRERSFRRKRAVTRTRRFALKLNSSQAAFLCAASRILLFRSGS